MSGAPYRMSPSQRTETLLLSSGGTSNLLARLEKKGWIRRLADPLDGRSVIVERTRAGRALADRAMADHAGMERQLVATFDAEERSALAGLPSRMLVKNNSPQARIADADDAGTPAPRAEATSDETALAR